MYRILLFALAVLANPPNEATKCSDERKLIRLFHNGQNEGQQLWITREKHFTHRSLFQRRMQSYSENGATNQGYLRPLEIEATVYRENGQPVLTWEDIQQGDNLFVVPSDELFMWPGFRIGRTIAVYEPEEDRLGIELETLSVFPRILRIKNLIKPEECRELVALNEGNMTRSAVGKVDNYDQEKSPKTNRRTSTNSFDDTSDVAKRIITRIFNLLHVTQRTTITDGLQVVKYATEQAYDIHSDFFPMGFSPEIGHNFDPMDGGGNRYATVFAFLTDDFQGGQTVFPHVPKVTAADGSSPINDPSKPSAFNAQEPMEEGELEYKGAVSWEEKMTKGMCANALAVQPKQGDAVLFYSGKTNGRLDPLTEHGGCPVLNGTKYGANLWVWNRNKPLTKAQYEVQFINDMEVPVQLYFFHAAMTPPLQAMAEILPRESRGFTSSLGDTFIAHIGPHWVGKWVVHDSLITQQVYRIKGTPMRLGESFEYHIGYEAGLRARREERIAAREKDMAAKAKEKESAAAKEKESAAATEKESAATKEKESAAAKEKATDSNPEP